MAPQRTQSFGPSDRETFTGQRGMGEVGCAEWVWPRLHHSTLARGCTAANNRQHAMGNQRRTPGNKQQSKGDRQQVVPRPMKVKTLTTRLWFGPQTDEEADQTGPKTECSASMLRWHLRSPEAVAKGKAQARVGRKSNPKCWGKRGKIHTNWQERHAPRSAGERFNMVHAAYGVAWDTGSASRLGAGGEGVCAGGDTAGIDRDRNWGWQGYAVFGVQGALWFPTARANARPAWQCVQRGTSSNQAGRQRSWEKMVLRGSATFFGRHWSEVLGAVSSGKCSQFRWF